MAAPIEPPPPPNPDENPPPSALPGLAGYLRPRYTSNVVVSEEVNILDLLNDVIFLSSRMFMSQGADGKIRLQNKKPVDFAYGTASFALGATSISVDDVSAWITNQKYFLLIAPHTNRSEVRVVTDANYPTTQNSVTLTGSTIFTISGFAGADGNNAPATASITVGAFTASTIYNITLDGIQIQMTPSISDTTSTIAGFIAGAIRGHPALYRRFQIVWPGANVVNLTARFGTLELGTASLEKTHPAPQASPTAAPTLTALASGTLAAGDYKVAYAYRNSQGQTLLSPYKNITLTVNQKISVSAITPPAGCTVVWYVVCEANSKKLRYHSENNGSAFEITSLPLLSAPLPPDLNRTGTEVMRIKAVFSDRGEVRSNIGSSNVLRGQFEWFLGNREDSVNRIDLKYRESAEDFRLKELRLRDDAHIARTKKILSKEKNGQAIDNYYQAVRIGTSLLAEAREADFFYKWDGTRKACLLEEFDVVAITDDGSGVINLPVSIEAIEINLSTAGLPSVNFTGRKFANVFYDDSPNDYTIPVVSEI